MRTVYSQTIIGLFVFENEGRTGSVNAERYRHLFKTFSLPQLGDTWFYWFQQDGARVHTARFSITLLKEHFRN